MVGGHDESSFRLPSAKMSAAIEGINRNQFTTEAADPGVGTQLLNDPFPTVRIRLAEMMMANISLCIDEISASQYSLLKVRHIA